MAIVAASKANGTIVINMATLQTGGIKGGEVGMKLSALKALILQACDNGYGDTEVDVVQRNSCVDDGCPVTGLRCVVDVVEGKEMKYVSIIEA